jgi:hypothetical protein
MGAPLFISKQKKTKTKTKTKTTKGHVSPAAASAHRTSGCIFLMEAVVP